MRGLEKFPDTGGRFYLCTVAQDIAAHNVGRALDADLDKV